MLFLTLAVAPPLFGEATEGTEATPARKNGEGGRMIRRAEILAQEGRVDEAMRVLKRAEARVKDEKKALKVDKLSSKVRERLLDQAVREQELLRISEKKRMLLEVGSHWLPPLPDKKEKAKEAPPEDKALERVKKPIPLIDFTDASLKEVVQFLAEASEVNIVIDEKTLTQDERVTVRLRDIALIDALAHILKTKKLAMQVEKDLILITTPEALEGELEMRVYDVQDLVGKLHDFPASPFNFSDIAKRSEKGEAAKT